MMNTKEVARLHGEGPHVVRRRTLNCLASIAAALSRRTPPRHSRPVIIEQKTATWTWNELFHAITVSGASAKVNTNRVRGDDCRLAATSEETFLLGVICELRQYIPATRTLEPACVG